MNNFSLREWCRVVYSLLHWCCIDQCNDVPTTVSGPAGPIITVSQTTPIKHAIVGNELLMIHRYQPYLQFSDPIHRLISGVACRHTPDRSPVPTKFVRDPDDWATERASSSSAASVFLRKPTSNGAMVVRRPLCVGPPRMGWGRTELGIIERR